MASNEIAFMSAAATAKAVRASELSPTEAVEAYLERIDRLDSRLAAYITVTREEALDAARLVEDKLERGEDAGPLAGVPVAIKDQFWTDGILTSNGSRVYRDFVPTEDATIVRRLKDAGATLLGKLNLSELAMGGTQEPPYGIPANPWDLERTPGESSSGSGVALSAHLCAASIGEDTGGSGRGPAAYCGVVGLRPTFTRVSRYGMTHMCWFMDAAAPMTKTVEDCAIVLGVIAGYDERDPYTSVRPVPDYGAVLGKGVQGLRVGLIRELHHTPDMHPDVRAAVESSLETLRGLGAEVREVSIPLVELAGAIFVGVADTEGAGARDEILRTRANELDQASRTRLLSASLVPFKVYNRATKARVLLEKAVHGRAQRGGCPGISHVALPGAPAHGADGAVRERRGRADALLLPPGLHRLLFADRTACHFHTRWLHQRRTAHRPATRGAALRRRDAVPRRPRLRAGDRLAYPNRAGGPGINRQELTP